MTPNYSTHAMATHPLLTGSGLAVLSLPLHLVIPAETSVLLASLTLALIAGVYLGFAFSDGRLPVMLTELFVALAFTAAALGGAILGRSGSLSLSARTVCGTGRTIGSACRPGCRAGTCRSAPFSTGSMRRGFSVSGGRRVSSDDAGRSAATHKWHGP